MKKRGRPKKGHISPTERLKRLGNTKVFNPSGRGRPYKNAFKCKYCEKKFTDKNSMLAHSITCINNPNRDKNIRRRSQVLIERYPNRRQYAYTLYCRRCGKQYEVIMNEHDFQTDRYKFYCSTKCRYYRPQQMYLNHSYTRLKRIISIHLSLNALRGNTSKAFSMMKFAVIKICPECKTQFLAKSEDKIYCSKECRQKAEFFKKKKEQYLDSLKPLKVGISGWYGGNKNKFNNTNVPIF